MLLITTFASQVKIAESNIVRSFQLWSNFSRYIYCYRSISSISSSSSRSRKGASSIVVTVVDITFFFVIALVKFSMIIMGAFSDQKGSCLQHEFKVILTWS